MNKPNITTDPWLVGGNYIHKSSNTSPGYKVAWIAGDGPQNEWLPNIRAIAVVPELLEALEMALSVIEDLPYPANHPADKLRETLKKAGYTF